MWKMKKQLAHGDNNRKCSLARLYWLGKVLTDIDWVQKLCLSYGHLQMCKDRKNTKYKTGKDMRF